MARLLKGDLKLKESQKELKTEMEKLLKTLDGAVPQEEDLRKHYKFPDEISIGDYEYYRIIDSKEIKEALIAVNTCLSKIRERFTTKD